MAPLLQESGSYCVGKSDSYSFGMVFYTVLTKKQPLTRDLFLNEIPKSLRNLIADCLKSDPEERPSSEDIVGELEAVLTL